MKAVKCPLCNGKGIIIYCSDTSRLPSPANCPTSQRGRISCNGCNGKGWIEVHE